MVETTAGPLITTTTMMIWLFCCQIYIIPLVLIAPHFFIQRHGWCLKKKVSTSRVVFSRSPDPGVEIDFHRLRDKRVAHAGVDPSHHHRLLLLLLGPCCRTTIFEIMYSPCDTKVVKEIAYGSSKESVSCKKYRFLTRMPDILVQWESS
jgi:hypothetical protein